MSNLQIKSQLGNIVVILSNRWTTNFDFTGLRYKYLADAHLLYIALDSVI